MIKYISIHHFFFAGAAPFLASFLPLPAGALSAASLAAWATNKLARAWFNWKLATPRAVLAALLPPLWLFTYLVASSRAFWAAVNAASAMLRLAWASSLACVARLTAFLAFLVVYLA